MDVDVMASGMEEILTALRLTGKEAATYNAVINGEQIGLSIGGLLS